MTTTTIDPALIANIRSQLDHCWNAIADWEHRCESAALLSCGQASGLITALFLLGEIPVDEYTKKHDELLKRENEIITRLRPSA